MGALGPKQPGKNTGCSHYERIQIECFWRYSSPIFEVGNESIVKQR